MAARELYDYLEVVAPDIDVTLGAGSYNVRPQGVIFESGAKNQVINQGDDDSEEIITLSSGKNFRVRLQWETITESEAGTLMDFYWDEAKGDCRANTFKWQHPYDGHTYVVRYDCDFERRRRAHDIYGILDVTFRVLGKIADTQIFIIDLFDPNVDLIQQIDYDGNGNPEYIGKAQPGTLSANSLWQIKKLTYDANQNVTSIGFAEGGNTYTHIWNDRATYTYS